MVEHARARSDPEEDLHLRKVTPGLLAKHATGRGTSKQRQCWAIDAATLQVPDGWGERRFKSKVTLTAHTGTALTGSNAALSKRAATADSSAAEFSMGVASPPPVNPVVFLCADNTVRLWQRRPNRGYRAKPNEYEGFWCSQRPKDSSRGGKGNGGGSAHIALSARATDRTELSLQLDSVPSCIARAKGPDAIAATWLHEDRTWSFEPRVVVGMSDGTIRSHQLTWDGEFYDFERGGDAKRGLFHEEGSAVLCCLRGSQSYMVSGGQDHAVVLSDQHRWAPLWRGRAHTEGVACLDFDPATNRFVSGGDDRRVLLWDVSVGASPVRELPRSEPVVSVAFSEGHPHLLSVAYADQTVRLWDMRRTPICLQEAVDQSKHSAGDGMGYDTAKYTAACFDSGTHSMICAGTHAVGWRIRPTRPTFWKRRWRHTVRVVLVFLRWYVRHRSGKPPSLTHDAPVLLVEYVPRLAKVLTLDVCGVVRLWEASPPSDDPLGNVCKGEYRTIDTDEPEQERVCAACVLPQEAGDSAGDLVTVTQSGKLAVHRMVEGVIATTHICSAPQDPDELARGAAKQPSWSGVPVEPLSVSYTPGLQGHIRGRPLCVLGRDGSLWLCAHQPSDDTRGSTVIPPPLQLIPPPPPRAPALASGLSGRRAAASGVEGAFVTAACSFDSKALGGGPLVLAGCRPRNKAGEALVRAFERGVANRPAVRPSQTLTCALT